MSGQQAKPVQCRICSSPINHICMTATIWGKERNYYHCPVCEYLQTEEPDWLDKAYETPINNSDTGILQRNIHNAKITSILLYGLGKQEEVFLDYAGGYGLFTRLMRDIGFNFNNHDPYTDPIFASRHQGELNKNYGAITAFEVFEHLIDPLETLEKLLRYTDTIILSTELLPEPIPLINEWYYYETGNGQHIGFFRKKTLEWLRSKFNLYLATNGFNFHIFSKAPLSSWRKITLFSRLNHLVAFLVKKRMVSKTLDDHNQIEKKLL